MTITKQKMKQVRERLEGALKGVFDDMKLEVTIGRGSYGDDNASFKLNITWSCPKLHKTFET